MKAEETALPGVIIIEPDVYGDARGYFQETWNAKRYKELGLEASFVQDNLSFSQQNILRGLHVQNPQAQGKLVQVLLGEVFDVAVDIRKGSPHFGQWVGVNLSVDNHRQFYIPQGFAHGFCVLSESALFAYKCTELYHPENELCISWDDPDIAIDWPINSPLLSKKDEAGLLLQHISEENLPVYR